MMTLNIRTSQPRLDIMTTNARMNITNRIRRFSARRVSPQMKVERQGASFKVDWSQVWAESGRKSPERLRAFLNQQSHGKVSKAINRIVQNGNHLMRLENYIGTEKLAVAEVAVADSISEMPEVNVSSMPTSRPNVQWDPGYVKIEWTTGEMQIEWDNDYMPDITVTPHSVEIRVDGHSEVKLAVDEKNIAKIGGRKVNKKI